MAPPLTIALVLSEFRQTCQEAVSTLAPIARMARNFCRLQIWSNHKAPNHNAKFPGQPLGEDADFGKGFKAGARGETRTRTTCVGGF